VELLPGGLLEQLAHVATHALQHMAWFEASSVPGVVIMLPVALLYLALQSSER
jgi:hypothetical protein